MKLILFVFFGFSLSNFIWAASKIEAIAIHPSNQLKESRNITSNLIPNDAASLIDEIPSLKAIQANWVFSGIVTNENGEYYSYFFQMRRESAQLYAIAALINDQNKQVVLFEEHHAKIEVPEENHWRAGNAFLKFNPINNSWIFGVRAKNKPGFNFKVDMLSRDTSIARNKALTLRPGVSFLINQTGRLNGHIQLGGSSEKKKADNSNDQFITGHTAWFRQIWTTKPQGSLHPFQGILCQFKEGNSFFSLNLAEKDALMGAIAGWRNPQGEPVRMSQFVAAQESKAGEWHINITTPKAELSFQNALVNSEKKQLIMGIMEDKPGFCVINNDAIG